MRVSNLSVSLAFLFVACGGGETPTPSPTGTPTAAEPTPSPTPTAGPTPSSFPSDGKLVYVSTVASDYSTGTLTVLDPLTGVVREDFDSYTSDTVVHATDSQVYIFARIFGGPDAIYVRGGRDLSDNHEIDIEGGPNPHDLAFAAGKGYISLYNDVGILVFNPSTYEVLDIIDLTEWGDSDGDPNVSNLLVSGGKLYASVQRVDYNTGFTPLDPGYVLEIDPATDTVSRAFSLTGTNATSLYVDGDTLWVATPGGYGVADGGIETVDLGSGESGGFILEESELSSASVGGFVVVDGVGYLSDGGTLKAFALSDGALSAGPAVTDGLSVSGLWVAPWGDLWFASEGTVNAWTPGTDALHYPGGLDVGAHVPYSVAFATAAE